MEKVILERLTTLGHPQRMALFRLLMRRYPQAVPAGELAKALDLKASTLSVYLSALAGVNWHYIAPGKPAENAFIESFNAMPRAV